MAKYAQAAQDHGFSFTPAIFSHKGQARQAAMDLTLSQIKLKTELADQEAQSGEAQSALNFWVKQSSCVVNRATCRSILTGAAFLAGVG